jgi:hypothetical protein
VPDPIGAAGFIVATILAILKVREYFARPDLRLDCHWMGGGGEQSLTLRVVASNRGKGKGGIRAIVVAAGENADRDHRWLYWPVWDKMPRTLEPGDLASFDIPTKLAGSTTLAKGLTSGTITHAILFDERDRPKAFRIPQRTDERNRMTTYGRLVHN